MIIHPAALIFLDRCWQNSAPKTSTEIYYRHASFVKIGTLEDILPNCVNYFPHLFPNWVAFSIRRHNASGEHC